ncbi:MAG TPA: carboxymuconolactone decarboxylase family protein [Bryobacteraceae bacterium]
MARIPLASPETLTPEQQRVYDRIVAGPRKRVVGPLLAALHNPELADRWQQLGELLRYGTSLGPKVSELAILVTARRWNTPLEWQVHAEAARKAGIPDAVIEALRTSSPPDFDDSELAVVYEYTRQLQEQGQVSASTYQDVLERLGIAGIVELTAVIGYYTMVAMTLNAHHISRPEDTDITTTDTLSSLASARNLRG